MVKIMSKSKYQNKYSCNKCGEGQNQITKATATDGGYVSECETKCGKCGFIDYWAQGLFISGGLIKSKAKTYCN